MTTNYHRKMWALAGPILISNISIPLLGLVDTAVLGHLDDPRQLGAVALGAAILSTLLWSFGFLRMGTTGMVARAVGKGDGSESRILFQGLFIAFIAGAGIFLSQWLWQTPVIAYLSEDPLLNASASSYIDIRLLSTVATLSLYVINGWFIGTGDTRTPLLLMVTMNLLNIVGDLVLVMYLDMGAAGAAWATVMAEFSCLVLGIMLIVKRANVGIPRFRQLTDGLSGFLSANLALMIRTMLLVGCLLVFNLESASYGAVTLAANAVLYQLVVASAYLLDAYAHASETLCGQALGKADSKAFAIAERTSRYWSIGSSLVITGLLWLFIDGFVALLSDQPNVLNAAADYQVWVVFIPLLSVLSYHYDGVFIGANAFGAMRNIMLVAAIAFVLVIYTQTALGNHRIWLALAVLNATRSLLMQWSFLGLRKGWLSASPK